MAEFLSIDELNLDFDGKEMASKGDPFWCSNELVDLRISNIEEDEISNIEQNNTKCLGREDEKPSRTTPKDSENTATENSLTKRKVSLTGLKILDRVTTSLERERKAWMGQNNLDTRRRSYTSITNENLTKIDDEKAQLFMTKKANVPAEKPSGACDIFEDGPLERREFDSPFAESNQQHAW